VTVVTTVVDPPWQAGHATVLVFVYVVDETGTDGPVHAGHVVTVATDVTVSVSAECEHGSYGINAAANNNG
jgi:hypothetical protein